MYDHTLASLNQRYKTGTNHVEDWLVKAVRQRYDLLGTSCSLDHTSFRNPSLDLIKLAWELHAGCRPTIAPPQDVDVTIKLIKNVIAGRREAAKWHQQIAKDHKASREDYAHNRFREVLCDVLDILQQVQQTSMSTVKQARIPKPRRSTRSSSEDSVPCVTSTKSGAPDPLSRSVALPLPNGYGPRKNIKRRDERALEIDNHDPAASFALVCFLNECYDVRETLNQTWVDVGGDEKTTSFAVACLATNSGIAMITDSAKRFSTSYPKFATFDDVLHNIDAWYMRSVKSDGNYSGADFGRDGILEAKPKVPGCELVCLPALDLLRRIRRLVQGKEHDALLQIMRGHALGADIATSLPELNKLRHDAERRKDGFGGCDVFSQLMMSFSMEPRALPFATVMALQIWMDIYDCLGRKLEVRKSEEFISSMEQVFGARSALLQHEGKAVSASERSLVGEQESSSLRDRLLDIVKQGVETPLSIANTVPLPAHLSKGETSRVLATLPGLCGHVRSTVCEMAHAEGVRMCNQGLLVHSIAHLYRAAQKSSPNFWWDDLEFLIFHQRFDAFDLQAYQASTDAVELFARSLGAKSLRQKTGKRLPLPSFEICSAKAKILHGSRAYASQCKQDKADLSQPDQLVLSCQRLAERPTGKGRAVTKSQSLEILQKGLSEEEVYFRFDHRAFFKDCLNLMEHIMQGLEPGFHLRLPDNAMFYQVVYDLLWEEKTCFSDKNTPISFAKAVAILTEHSTHAKHFSTAEGIVGIPDEKYRLSRPGAIQAQAKKEEAKAEKARQEKADAIKAQAARKNREREEEREARAAERAGQYRCPDCGRWSCD